MPANSRILALSAMAAAMASMAFAGEPSASAPDPAQPQLFHAQARIEVDATGAVVAVAPSPTLPDAVDAAMVENLRKIRFSPVLKDGRAVAGVTYARQEACAIPDGGKYRMVVRYLGNGPGALQSGDRLIRPLFPADAQMAGASAAVKVAYKVMPDGRLNVETVDLVSGRGRYGHAFVAATRAWLESQRSEPEQLDGQPVVTDVAFTMEFRGGQSFTGPNARRLAEQQAQAAMEKERLARIAASKACASASRERDSSGQQVALNSPFHALLDGSALQ